MVSNHLFEGSVLGILYLEDLIHLEVNTISFQGRSFLEFGLLIIIIIIIIIMGMSLYLHVGVPAVSFEKY